MLQSPFAMIHYLIKFLLLGETFLWRFPLCVASATSEAGKSPTHTRTPASRFSITVPHCVRHRFDLATALCNSKLLIYTYIYIYIFRELINSRPLSLSRLYNRHIISHNTRTRPINNSDGNSRNPPITDFMTYKKDL